MIGTPIRDVDECPRFNLGCGYRDGEYVCSEACRNVRGTGAEHLAALPWDTMHNMRTCKRCGDVYMVWKAHECASG